MDVFPASLRQLVLPEYFNRPLVAGVLPTSLTHLAFADFFWLLSFLRFGMDIVDINQTITCLVALGVDPGFVARRFPKWMLIPMKPEQDKEQRYDWKFYFDIRDFKFNENNNDDPYAWQLADYFTITRISSPSCHVRRLKRTLEDQP